MVNKVKSLILEGVEGKVVEIEANLLKGLNKFTIVGLPDRSINEAKERITSALLNSTIPYPYGQLIVNLSPAFLEKSGTSLDLPICLGVLMSGEGKVKKPKLDLNNTIVIGELGLDGKVRRTKSAPAFVMAAKILGFKNIILPAENFVETQYITGLRQYPVTDIKSLLEVVLTGESKFNSQVELLPANVAQSGLSAEAQLLASRDYELRILALAAAGRHNILFDGPPGSGKSTLLANFNVLLPQLAEPQALEVFKLHSLVEECTFERCKQPPFRAPHHSISDTALIGGGTKPTPGEISLAHNGVLYLDEVCEFSRYALEALRQPLVDKTISIARASYKAQFPADFQLLATRNPCPCGWDGDRHHKCSCTKVAINAYKSKLSGPLLDRIDIKHRVENISNYKSNLSKRNHVYESKLSSTISKIINAREIQKKRYRQLKLDKQGITFNTNFNNPLHIHLLQLNKQAHGFIKELYDHHKLTLRSIFKITKLARTIADFDGKIEMDENSLLEAYNLNSY